MAAESGVPKIRSEIQTPRSTGDVLVPLAVTFKIDPWAIKPPRCDPGLQRDSSQLIPFDAVDVIVASQTAVQKCEIGINQRRVALASYSSSESRNRCVSSNIAFWTRCQIPDTTCDRVR